MKLRIEKESIDFRKRYGYSSSAPINLNSLLIHLNVIAVFKPLSDTFSGMAVKYEDSKFMLINSNHSIGRQNFSICHELYHLYIQDNFNHHHSSCSNFDKSDKNEYMADLFASYLLMPKNGIINLIPDKELEKDKINLDTIIKLEHYFSCSRSALLRRLQELGILSKKKSENYNSNIKMSARNRGYLEDLYNPGNEGLIIGDFGSIAKNLYDSEKISEGHYIENLSIIGIDPFSENQ